MVGFAFAASSYVVAYLLNLICFFAGLKLSYVFSVFAEISDTLAFHINQKFLLDPLQLVLVTELNTPLLISIENIPAFAGSGRIVVISLAESPSFNFNLFFCAS